uniref:Alcohol dehydrogenase n=3 Tax=Ceratitis capitata TaxID=7213 RepID=W8AZS7_CERCA
MEELQMELTGKNIVYIGGFGGIGVETSKLLVKNGVANLMILNKTWNESAYNEIYLVDTNSVCQFMAFDVTAGLAETRSIFAKIVEKLGHIDVLINGVGICEERDFDLIISTNLMGTINTTLVAYDHMDKSKGGRGGVIVSIASVAALTPFVILPIYSATKGGILTFTRALAALKPKTGITLSTICPGPTETSQWTRMNSSICKEIDFKGYARGRKHTLQSPAECAINIVKAIKTNENGATWMCDLGQLKLVEIKNFWTPPCGKGQCCETAEQRNNTPCGSVERQETKQNQDGKQRDKPNQDQEEGLQNKTTEKVAALPPRKRKYEVSDLGRDMQNMKTSLNS